MELTSLNCQNELNIAKFVILATIVEAEDLIIFNPDFIDRVYEAALVSEKWKDVLDRLAGSTDAVGTVLLSATDERSTTIFSDALAPFMAQSSEWFGGNIRSQLLLTLPPTEFHSDADYISEEQMSADRLYRDYLWKHGLGNAAATWIKVSNGDNLIISIERRRERGAFDRSEEAKGDCEMFATIYWRDYEAEGFEARLHSHKLAGREVACRGGG